MPPIATESPVLVPRDAATVMLVRDAPGLEVFMLRRNFDSVWIAGASVFPGGAVDEDDRDPSWAGRCPTDESERAAAALGRADALAFLVAAVRETFEEAGVLLARDRDGSPVDASAVHLTAARLALNAGEHAFADFVRAHDLLLATDELHVFSHWITPPGGPRRYDTWFFLAAAPEGEYRHDDTELIESAWIQPRAALAAADAGEMELILPTRKNLEALARFDRADAVLAASRPPAGSVPPGPDRFVAEATEGSRIPLPGDRLTEGEVPCPT
ncbi:MAG: NUDIX hydrolase [Acidimicrobiia bacterium]